MKKIVMLTAVLLCLTLAGCGGDAGTTSGQSKALESISAYPETMNLSSGGSETIQVVLTPSDADAKDLIWASSNREVAVVDESGKVSAISDGTCTITIASKEYSDISCHVEVIVGGSQQTSPAATTPADGYVIYVPETNAAAVYPTYSLSESEVAAMSADELQFTINQIYAKNGYIFRTDNIQSYFSQMPWYVPVSGDASQLHMSALDRSNLNLLVRYRDSSSTTASGVGWIWTRSVVDSALTSSYVSRLSQYDIQLLINTIYAKNGYIFETDSLQAMFEGQSWYIGRTRDSSSISFSSLDQQNLRLLTSYRG